AGRPRRRRDRRGPHAPAAECSGRQSDRAGRRHRHRGDGMTVVFVGPTLSRDDVRSQLPAALIRPPVALGDVLELALAKRRTNRIAIIDGYFERMAAVW